MKLFQKLVCMALTATATASLSICAFAADYTFDTAADTDYYPSTSYEDTYGTAYHYGGKNLVDYQIPELPYGVLSTTQTGVMEKLRLPGLQQTVGGSATGIYGVFRRDELERFRPSPNPQANAGKYPHSHPCPLRFSG